MNELSAFFIQFMLAFLLLGCLLAAGISLALRCFSLNAATRHKVWLTALLVLIFAPILSLVPTTNLQESRFNSMGEVRAQSSGAIDFSSWSIENAQPSTSQKPDGRSISAGSVSGYPVTQQSRRVSIAAVQSAIAEFSLLRELAVALFAILVVGALAKGVAYLRSLRSLRELIDSSELVGGKFAQMLAHSCSLMDLHQPIELRQSERLSTPSTCGVLTPCIILPSAMLRDSRLADSLEQVLLHELAHIKRRDPFIAGLQAVVSIFLFWHPGVNYVNTKIRYEREIASDDWVVDIGAGQGNANVKAYAYSIVGIAESLSGQSHFAHSVACVNKSLGLQERIRILLDRGVDHSTSVNLMPNVWVASLAIGFMVFSSTLLPKLPPSIFQQARGAELAGEVAGEVAGDSTVPQATSLISMRSLDTAIVVEPPTLTSESASELVVEYAAPLPMPDIDLSLERLESSAVFARSQAIESQFSSERSSVAPANYLAVESIKPTHGKVIPVSLDAFVAQPAQNAIVKFVVESSEPSDSGLVVIDDLSRTELADEILKIELEMYRVFNTLTDRRDLKMICESESYLGSYINETYCEPEFLRTARSENLHYSMQFVGPTLVGTSKVLKKNFEAEYIELAAEFLKEMKNNSYLFELYQVLAGLKGRLAEIA